MSEETKKNIISSAYKLFAQKGVEGTSVRDIASEANANVSAISYHFGSKDKLFLFLMKDFGVNKAKAPLSYLNPPKTIEEMRVRLELFFSSIIELSLKKPDEMKFFHHNIEKYAEVAPEEFKQTLLGIHTSLVEFIKSAQKAKILGQTYDPEILCQIVFGGLFDMTSKAQAKKRFFNFDLNNERFRKKYIETLIDSLVKGQSDV